jgi:hypothetical protein
MMKEDEKRDEKGLILHTLQSEYVNDIKKCWEEVKELSSVKAAYQTQILKLDWRFKEEAWKDENKMLELNEVVRDAYDWFWGDDDYYTALFIDFHFFTRMMSNCSQADSNFRPKLA